jgi:flavin reductase (DIM6/NTAB) family NADH-FMN oxidoreductase RutF
MITRDLRSAAHRDLYRILSSLVIPRPIAWVTTLGETGVVNLAPFSSFMGIFNPPMVALTVSLRRDGSLKDTHRNLRERGEAVVHMVDLPLLEAMHASGEDLPPEESELERLGLATTASSIVGPPRLAAAPAALECTFQVEQSLGPTSSLLLLNVLLVHADERIWSAKLDCADASLWEPVARLAGGAGPNYAGLSTRITLGEYKLPPRDRRG